jgi:small GTP-binding protein
MRTDGRHDSEQPLSSNQPTEGTHADEQAVSADAAPPSLTPPSDLDGVLSELFGDVPNESRAWIRSAYEALPSDKKGIIAANLRALAKDTQPAVFYRIVRLALRQYEGVFDSARRQISIVGPVNTGKSSLFNALLLPKQPQAKVSPVPGTTREIQAGDAGLCTVIDTPGGDEAAGEERKRLAFKSARQADSLIVVFDAQAGIDQGTRDLFDELRQLDKPMTLVLNKMDLVAGYEREVIAQAAHNLGVSEEELIPVSVIKRINLQQIVFSLIRTNPGLLALVSELVPQYRRQIATRYIAGAAMSSFVVGSSPLPVADFFPLMAIQIGLVLQLGRVYGQQVAWDTAKEVLLALGGGVGLREGFRQLVKIVPVPIANWLGSGLYAAVGTAALGLAAREYWARGGVGSPSDWKQTADRFRKELWDRLGSPQLLKRFHDRKHAADLLEETLEEQIAEIEPTDTKEEPR